jgi:predicted nucleic acid-binding protein
MEIVLDASVTLAWLVRRLDPIEERWADEVLGMIQTRGALVPALWFPEVANGVLAAERRAGASPATSASFMALIDILPIVEDTMRPAAAQARVLSLARTYELTGYDATYLELVLRTGRTLATFDRQLAEAVHKAGGRVFGDAA